MYINSNSLYQNIILAICPLKQSIESMLLDLFIVPYFFIQCCSKIPNSIIAQLFHQCQTLGCGDCHGLIIKHPHVTDGSVYGYSGIMSQGCGWSNSWSAWLLFRGAGGWRSIKFCL